MTEVFGTIFLLAAIQGILLTVVLFAKKGNHTANRILASGTLCLSVDLLFSLYYGKGWHRQFPHLMGITYPFPSLYGPLFYLYVMRILKKEHRFPKREWLHFIPAALVYVLCLPVYLYSGEQKIEFIGAMMHGNLSPLFFVFNSLIPLQGLLYTYFSIKRVKEYQASIKENLSNIDLINLNWLKYFTIALCAIWVIVAVLWILRFVIHTGFGLGPALQLSISILIYSIGYKGLRQPEIFFGPPSLLAMQPKLEKYSRSGLNEAAADDLKQRLIAIVSSEKLFLDDDLTLQRLADRLKTSTHNLSEVINSRLNLTYYDFINNYRIEEFKQRVADPMNDQYNILSIAFDSGFKSKGTFNALFKKNTGLTPSEYKAKVRNNL